MPPRTPGNRTRVLVFLFSNHSRLLRGSGCNDTGTAVIVGVFAGTNLAALSKCFNFLLSAFRTRVTETNDCQLVVTENTAHSVTSRSRVVQMFRSLRERRRRFLLSLALDCRLAKIGLGAVKESAVPSAPTDNICKSRN